MKKKKLLFLGILLSFLFICLLSYQKIINFLLSIDISDPIVLIIYIFLIFIYFLIPLPTTLIILFNGFIFKELGFVISYVIIILSSLILFYFSSKINIFFKFKKIEKYFNNKLKFYNYTTKNISIFLSRFIVPFFFHNLYYGLAKVKFSKFLLIIILAEIPVTFALNSIGHSLKDFASYPDLSLLVLLQNVNFYVPFLIVLVLYFVINKFKDKLH